MNGPRRGNTRLACRCAVIKREQRPTKAAVQRSRLGFPGFFEKRRRVRAVAGLCPS